MTRASNLSKLVTDANLEGTLDVAGAFTSLGIDDNADAVAMTIDSSENVMIGKTSSNLSTAGSEFASDGLVRFTRSNVNAVVNFNKKDNDGDIVSFRKDDTQIGSIGSNSGILYIGSPEGTDAFLGFGNNIIRPVTSTGASRDNAIDLGYTGMRFKDLYLSGGAFIGGTGSANLLDDFEEGTFNISSAGAGYTISAQGGKYTKIGDTVHCIFKLTFSAVNSGATSNVTLSTLPFTNSSFQSTGTVRESTNTGVIYVINVPPGSNDFTISSMDGVGNGNQRTIRVNENYVGSFTYKV